MSRGTRVSLGAAAGGWLARGALALDRPVEGELGSGEIDGHSGTGLADPAHDSGTDMLTIGVVMNASAALLHSAFERGLHFGADVSHDLARA